MTQTRNPFLTATPVVATDSTPEISDAVMGESILMAGPQDPGLLPSSAADAAETWPTEDVGQHSGTVLLGLHGGAGVSTLAAVLDSDTEEMRTSWPVSRNPWTGEYSPIKVIAVARDDASGLQKAERFAKAWAAGQLTGSHLCALVLVAASPTTSDARTRATRKILRMVPHGAHVPWMPTWIESPVDPNHLPPRIKRIAKALRKTTQPPKEKS